MDTGFLLSEALLMTAKNAADLFLSSDARSYRPYIVTQNNGETLPYARDTGNIYRLTVKERMNFMTCL